MGIYMWRSSSDWKYVQKSVIVPEYSYTLHRREVLKACQVVWLVYPNCENLEGNKILIIRNTKQLPKRLDPHFSEDNGLDVFARFKPSDENFSIALNFARTVVDLL
jgi:hypothetical protein